MGIGGDFKLLRSYFNQERWPSNF